MHAGYEAFIAHSPDLGGQEEAAMTQNDVDPVAPVATSVRVSRTDDDPVSTDQGGELPSEYLGDDST